MRLLIWLVCGLLLAMVISAIVLPEDADKARIMDGFGQAVFAAYGLLVLAIVIRWRYRPARAATVTLTGLAVINPVIVDGSNVMHWGGEPSLLVLSRVLQELQNRGFGPLVYFDANAGYKLFDRHMDPPEMASKLGLPVAQVAFAPSRTTADEVLLAHAVSDDLRVVTNDRFLDWKQLYPQVGDKSFLIKGMWKEGNVILFGLGRSGRVAQAA